MFLDVAYGLRVPSANVWQHAYNGTSAQRWAITKNQDGTYSLTSKLSGYRLTVHGPTVENGSNVYVGRVRNAADQTFTFKKVPLLSDGTYTFYSRLAPTYSAIDIASGSTAQGAAAQLFRSNDSPAQRFFVERVAGDIYTFKSVASGRFLADASGRVVQQLRASGAAAKAQQWRLSWRVGIVATNVATGRVIQVSGSVAADGAKLATAEYTGHLSQRFRPVRQSTLIGRGLYTIASRASGAMLDVAGGSWDNGANAQLYYPNGTNAQKFAVVPLGGDSYRIVMALSGTALEADSSSAASVRNVRLSNNASNDAQIWNVRLSDWGLVFTNKASGLELGAATAKAPAGTNVVVSKETGDLAHKWRLTKTWVNAGDLGSIKAIVDTAWTSGEPVANMRGMPYAPSQGARQQLMDALSRAWNNGRTVNFLAADLGTGSTLAMRADARFHGASTFKAAYVTYIFQDLIEQGRVSYGDVASLVENTVVHSNNVAYESLRSRFGNGGFAQWLGSIGLSHMAGEWYPFTTARNLARIWAKIYSYEQSGGRFVDTWRRVFSHSEWSYIRQELSGYRSVYSKPGGHPTGFGSGPLHNDAAIVRDGSGRTYLLAMHATTEPSMNNNGTAKAIVAAIDRMMQEMPRL